MRGFLAEVYQRKKEEVAAYKETKPIALLPAAAQNQFETALRPPGVHIIAEVKPASPSAGTLREEVAVESILQQYEQFASAVSVLTDAHYFKGSYELLSRVTSLTGLPVLCKDFIIDESQIIRARECGAHAALLIVKMLSEARLLELASCCRELGMTAVFEVQTVDEMEVANRAGAKVILINNRDLENLKIDLATTTKLAARASASAVLISASGIESGADLAALLPYAKRFLIGSALMKSDDIARTGKDLLAGLPAGVQK